MISTENVKFKKPVNPPNTRWARYYLNLASIVYLKKPFNRLFLESDRFYEFTLSAADWKLIEASCKILKLFRILF